MPKAFMMIDVEPGKEYDVQKEVAGVSGVEFVHQVTGEHDMIAFIDTESHHDFSSIVNHIRKISGVKDTDTQLVLE